MTPQAEIPQRFINEIASICLNPNLLKDKKACASMFPESVARAESYVNQAKVGAYSCSKGIESIRKRLAQKMSQRDNLATDPEDFFLTYGGMDAYMHIISLFERDSSVSNVITF